MKIFVEGKIDKEIVSALVRRVAPDSEFDVVVVGKSLRNKQADLSFLEHRYELDGPALVVYDQEYGTVADHPEMNDQDGAIIWCPAIPMAEAWLFADESALIEAVPDLRKDIVDRLPAPENIPYPKALKHNLLRNRNVVPRIIGAMNLEKAAARSASLAYFLSTIQKRVGKTVTYDSVNAGSRQIDKEIIKSLINEIYPSKQKIFISSDGYSYTATDMLREVTVGSVVGREYATAILRVARDFLKRQAEREKQSNKK